MVVKVCGMRDAQNIREVAQLGVSALGFIFYPQSPRCVKELEYGDSFTPALVRGEADMQIPRIGVFVDDDIENVLIQSMRFSLNCIQLHGNETREYCEDLNQGFKELIEMFNKEAQKHNPDVEPFDGRIQIIKAISVNSAEDIQKYKDYVGAVDYFLFDTKCKQKGGSGVQFDWSVLDAYDGDVPFLLSGGIGPDDAERVKAIKHPMLGGIDINSKFEKEPGIKDVEKIKKFLEELG